MEKNHNILVTGATGQVGSLLIEALQNATVSGNIYAATTNPDKYKKNQPGLHAKPIHFDFANPATHEVALDNIETIFLLRPPQLADTKKYFAPLIHKMVSKGVKNIVFLSVQGVEKQKMIPHFKIEKMIKESGLNYVFLRPSYFMQNLTSTLLEEIQQYKRIYIPAGKVKFNWVDVGDIALVGAHVIQHINNFTKQALEITGSEFEGFDEVAKMLSEATGENIAYNSPNLISFYFHERKKGTSTGMIMVMIMLHYLPRLSKNVARLTDTVYVVTGKKPTLLREFIRRERNHFLMHG